jgi:hypothetical protein
VSERFRPGDQVRARRTDPPHHTRVPRYVRGAVGTVVEPEGAHPLPDLRSRGLPAPPEPVYAVRFTARELFGTGDHTVTIGLWESYLQAATPAGAAGQSVAARRPAGPAVESGAALRSAGPAGESVAARGPAGSAGEQR